MIKVAAQEAVLGIGRPRICGRDRIERVIVLVQLFVGLGLVQYISKILKEKI